MKDFKQVYVKKEMNEKIRRGDRKGEKRKICQLERDVFLNDNFKRSTRYPCLSSLLESRLALRITHSYEEQTRAYRIS